MNKNHTVGILTADIDTGHGEFQVFPAGEFRARDGRPHNAKAYRVTATEAVALVEAFNARKTPMMVDYEHQALLAKSNGKPAPAAGWIHGLEWREGKGLFAINVKWTEAAKVAIQADEYRYTSPVFTYAPGTGEVDMLYNVALTNLPALDGMEAAVAHSLGFGDDAGVNELTVLRESVRNAQAELEALHTQLATLRSENSETQQRQAAEQVEQVVQGFFSAGKLLPTELAAARKFGAVDLEALSQLIEPRQSLFIMQSDRLGLSSPASTQAAQLTAADLRACELTGRSPEEFAALKARLQSESPNSLEV